jgi:DNA-binding response OmpR family regulator
MRLLIVEDEFLIANVMSDTLADAGHVVEGIAPDANTALEMVAESVPDLALVDFSLGKGPDGATLAQRLLRHYGLRSIYVSANAEECHKYGRLTGAFGCLSKPFTPDELVTSIDAVAALVEGKRPKTIPETLELYVVV